MTFWTPQTDPGRFIYDYRQPKFQGIRASHQPSPWMGDYGHFTVMPFMGEVYPAPEQRSSAFRHEQEEARPHRYRVLLHRYDVAVQATASERCGVLRFRYPCEGSPGIVLQTIMGDSHVQVLPDQRSIVGYTRGNHGGCPDNFACYFVATLDTPIVECGIVAPDHVQAGAHKADGVGVGCFARFAASPERAVEMRIATSFISIEQAQRNLDHEIGEAGFEQIRDECERAWNELLGRFTIEGESIPQRQTFYTALYRSLLFPRQFHEVDSDGSLIHYSPYDGHVRSGPLYTDNGFWDTHRTLFPLLSLAYPDKLGAILEGMLNAYRESGSLPGWASPGHRDCMCGSHAEAVFADAIVKDIPGFDHGEAYEAIRHSACTPTDHAFLGRVGLSDYLDLGYVPADDFSYSVSRTLDYAYCDHAVAQAASKLGHNGDANELFARSKNYQHLWDASVGFMRGRCRDGRFVEPFDPFRWGGPYVEGGPWQHSWSVPHDPIGLADLLGGPANLVARLDEMLDTVPRFNVGTYGHEIHEMTEMALADFGQYAHSNQPVHHVLWLYAAVGAPDRTRYWTRQVMEQLYRPTPDGLPGDEDNGEMSAWYLFAAMGLYPLCLASGDYVLGQALLPHLSLQLPAGPTVTIQTRNQPYTPPSRERSASRQFVSHAQLTSGTTLTFHALATTPKD